MDVKAYRNYAQENIEKLEQRIPLKILNKEEKLYIKLSKSKLRSIKKLGVLYKAMDEVYEYVHQYTPCKKACSKCCFYNVSISRVEVQYIEMKEGIKSKPVVGHTGHDFHGSKCPFLSEKGTCEVYKSRPYVCRRFVTMTKDSYFCSHERSSFNLPLLAFTEFDKAYELIRVESGCTSNLPDIRDVFST